MIYMCLFPASTKFSAELPRTGVSLPQTSASSGKWEQRRHETGELQTLRN